MSARRIVGIIPKSHQVKSSLCYGRKDVLTARRNAVSALKLTGEVFDNFDGRHQRESPMIKTLCEESPLSTPRSIRNIIKDFSRPAEENDSAIIIQRNWRNFLSRRKMKKFCNYMKKLVNKKKLRFLCLWRLALLPSAEESRRCYSIITSGYNNIIPEGYEVVSFGGYMKTNFIVIGIPSITEDRLVSVTKRMFKSKLSAIIKEWRGLCDERRIVKTTKIDLISLSNQRKMLGSVFWTFHFWKRWVQFNKAEDRNIRKFKKMYFYLPEWNFFLANKAMEERLKITAFEQKRNTVIRNVIRALHNNYIDMFTSQQKTSDIQRKVNLSIMGKAYRAFLTATSFTRLKNGTRRRVIIFWYKYMDDARKNRYCLEIYNQRRVLTLINAMFRKWRVNIIEEGAGFNYIHDKIRSNKKVVMRFAYLIADDFVHYTQITAFQYWKKMIVKRKNAKRFMTWSLLYSRQDTIKRYILDCFRVKADKPVNMSNYSPFIIDTQQQTKKKKFFDIISKRKVSFDSFVNCISVTQNASRNNIKYEQCQKNFEDWTSDEVKNLFLQIIYLASVYKNESHIDRKDILKSIRNYRISNMLFNQAGVIDLRCKQNAEDEREAKIIRERNERDAGFILSMEAHDAAVEYNKENPKFKLGLTWKSTKKAKKKGGKKGRKSRTLSVSKKKKTEAKPKEDEEVKDVKFAITPEMQRKRRSRRHSIMPKDTKPVHPLLGPIETIRARLMEDIRKYRRDPKEIFTDKVVRRNINTRQLVQSASNIALSQQASTYESFIPVDLLNKVELEKVIEQEDLDVIKDDQEPVLIEAKKRSIAKFKIEKSQIEALTPPRRHARFRSQSIRVSASPMKIVPIKPGPKIMRLPPFRQELDTVLSDLSSKKKEKEEKKEAIEEAILEEKAPNISIDSLASSFINNKSFQNRNTNADVGYLTQKYFTLLDTLLGKKKRVPHIEVTQYNVQAISQDFPQVSSRISKVIRRLNQREARKEKQSGKISPKEQTEAKQQMKERREKKAQRLGVFDTKEDNFTTVQALDGKEYKCSNCPEFANVYFIGEQVLTTAPWESRVMTMKKPPEEAENYVSLQTPKINVKGFEDVPGFSTLATKVVQYFNPDEEEEAGEAIPEHRRFNNFMDLVDGVVNEYLMKEVQMNPSKPIDMFVDTSGVEIKAPEVPVPEDNKTVELPKKKFFTTKIKTFSHKAFGTESRQVKTPTVIEEKITFTSELLRAIKEGSEIMKEHTKKFLNGRERKNPFNGLEELKKRIQKRQMEVNKANEQELYVPPLSSRKVSVKTLKEIDNTNNEVALTIGGKDKRSLPHDSRPHTANTVTRARKIPKDDARDIIVTSRAKTSMKSTTGPCLSLPTSRTLPIEKIPNLSIAQLDSSKLSVRVHEAAVGKRKPQFTKMTPTAPRKPETLVYESTLPKRPKTAVVRDTTWKVGINKQELVTDADVDFLLFVTPYIVPPELLNEMFEETESDFYQ